MVDTITPTRRTQQRGIDTRRALLDAALIEFAAVGFEAASTRAIAARAGIKQGQLTYHFETKDLLWRATVDHVFARFDAVFDATAAAHPTPGPGDATSEFEAGVRALVRAVAGLPELNRLMVHASTAGSERLTWLVDRHVRPRFEHLGPLWQRVQAEGGTHLDADPLLIYYCLLGAASLLYVNAPEAAQLAGAGSSMRVASDAVVAAHADTLVAMLLGPRAG